MRARQHGYLRSVAALILMCFFTVSGWASESSLLDPKLRSVVAQCANCHGENGIATLPTAANLAGQNPIYTEIQLKNYRDGKRQDAVMAIAAQTLSDEDITALAEYYSQLPVAD